MQKIIFTSQPASAELCLNELNGAGLSFNFLKWLGAGVGILETDISFSDFSVAVRESRLIFLRHICPADIVISLENAGAANLNQAVLAVCDNIKDTLPKDSGFSVQVRRSADVKCDISGLQHTIADEISSCGCSLNVRCPVNILSVYICRDEAYIGMSAAADNLSSWPGGMRRYAMLPQTVSRAELKHWSISI